MIKLSQRAWNNVIIVSMLILIMLFNFSSHFLNEGSDDASSVRTLVPENMIITTMQYPQLKIERIGQGWRSTSGEYNNQSLAGVVEQWRGAEISLFEQVVTWPSSALTVKLWFAGQALPTEYHFMQSADKVLVKIDQQTYQLLSPDYHKLILAE